MYYSYPCTYCGRLFATYDDRKEHASYTLYYAIKKHLVDYDEDRKEFQMDDGHELDTNQIYYGLTEYNDRPAGAYII